MKFYTLVLVVVSMALGYALAPRAVAADGWGTSISTSAWRMANSLEKIEQQLTKCKGL